jgi:hypothetical protein
MGFLGFPRFLGRGGSQAALLACVVLASRDLLSIGLFSMSAPEAKSFALKLK